jgi:hypothetical protein
MTDISIAPATNSPPISIRTGFMLISSAGAILRLSPAVQMQHNNGLYSTVTNGRQRSQEGWRLHG